MLEYFVMVLKKENQKHTLQVARFSACVIRRVAVVQVVGRFGMIELWSWLVVVYTASANFHWPLTLV